MSHSNTDAAGRPMTAAEVVNHPEYSHTIWDLKPEKKGRVAVARNRGGPINIEYEVHGRGNKHLVVSTLHNFIPFTLFCCQN